MNELKLWKYVFDKISYHINVVLLIIAEASSASPGRTGFKMAVAEDGTSIGTIGGGIMEFDIFNEINNSFSNNLQMNFVRKLHHSNLASGDKSGLICGGVQTIVFKSLTKTNIQTITDILLTIEQRESGSLTITENEFLFMPNKLNTKDISLSNREESTWLFEENIGIQNTVYIVGGGHVGLAVSKIMAILDFYIVVFDHRSDVDTMNKNIFAHKKIITPYNEIQNHITEGNKSFVVVVTPSHDGDKDALNSVLKLDLKYIGSMGSAKKIKSIFSQLKNEGFSDDDLLKIHTPIGLEIEAETPEEIAISIAAEIIQIKNS